MCKLIENSKFRSTFFHKTLQKNKYLFFRNVADVFDSRVTFYNVTKDAKLEDPNSRRNSLELLKNFTKYNNVEKLEAIKFLAMNNWYYIQMSPTAVLDNSLMSISEADIQGVIESMESIFDLVLISGSYFLLKIVTT